MAIKKEKVGILIGGGPAPGINGVISSATIKAVNEGKDVIGINGGFKSLFERDKNCLFPLTIEDVSRIHTQGGSILRTSRYPQDKAKENFKALMSVLMKTGIKYLITIGGDGTLFMANWIEKEARGSINVAHIPKTIDNDIPLPAGACTFGYQTARHWGVELVKNLMEDAKTTGRWYFIITMGRRAGYLALGIGKSSGATITLIPEEFKEQRVSIKKVADILTGSIIKRLRMNKDHGVAILAEGIIEKFDNVEIRQYERFETDENNMLRLSEVRLGRILKNIVKKNLMDLGINLTIVDKNIGYEVRAAAPIPYDIEYTRNLGYGAVRYLLKGGSGSMIVFDDEHLSPIPFVEMMDFSTSKVKTRQIDITSENYEVARKYMIRLEREDFEDKNLFHLAKFSKLNPNQFKKMFGYIV